MEGGRQYDLFGEVEAAEATAAAWAARVAERAGWRVAMHLDCCTGLPCPPTSTGLPQVRCGRCGEFTFVYGMTINHDLGWIGCPRDSRDADGRFMGHQQFRNAEELSANRHDSLHHSPCGRCGHAWGVHSRGFAVLPAEECPCRGLCACPGYVALSASCWFSRGNLL